MQHVKDNYMGHTLHICVAMYSQIPLHMTWEREMNNLSEIATMRIYNNVFTPMVAPDQPGNTCKKPVSTKTVVIQTKCWFTI